MGVSESILTCLRLLDVAYVAPFLYDIWSMRLEELVSGACIARERLQQDESISEQGGRDPPGVRAVPQRDRFRLTLRSVLGLLSGMWLPFTPIN